MIFTRLAAEINERFGFDVRLRHRAGEYFVELEAASFDREALALLVEISRDHDVPLRLSGGVVTLS